MEFQAHYSSARLVGLAAIGFGFVALGSWMLGLYGSLPVADGSGPAAAMADLLGVSEAMIVRLIGGAGLLLGLLVFPAIFKLSQHKGPVMIINAQGIYVHRWADKPIPWSNVEKIESYQIASQKLVGITLKNRELDPQRAARKALTSVNRSMGYGDFALSLQGTDGKYQALLDTLAHYHVAAT